MKRGRKMRWLTGLVLVLGCLWGGYWFVGERGFETAARDWFDTLAASGKVATNSGLEVHGFPNRFDLTVTEPQLADPASGLGWQAPFFQVLSLSYKPWHVIAAFPPEQRLTLPHEGMIVRSGKLQASVVVKPQPALPLDRFTLIGNTIEADGDRGWVVKAETLQFATRLDESRVNRHEIGLNVTNLVPDAALMAVFAGALPSQVGLIRVDAHIGFTGPIDRQALTSPPQIASVELDNLRIEWGQMQVTAQGNVTADAAGFAEGNGVLQLKNWRVALDVAQSMGILSQKDRKLWEQAAMFLAKQSDSLDLPLQFKNGRSFIGPLAVGPAPRLR
jgi:hypothetical protein